MLPDLGTQFFVSLVGIVIADLVLAGDNAVVIALAARNLQQEQRRIAVLVGAALAIVLRAVLTLGAVYLLRGELPGVMLVGGIALLWIGFRLAMEEERGHADSGIRSATTMHAAIQTIIVADVVMSIDNVLAVAAFAKDEPWLVVFGLLISIPIVMGGAALLLRLIDRFPLIVWIGAALILYVGVELILRDPWVHGVLPHALSSDTADRIVGALVGGVLAAIAWWLRARVLRRPASNPDDPKSRLMVEGDPSDD